MTRMAACRVANLLPWLAIQLDAHATGVIEPLHPTSAEAALAQVVKDAVAGMQHARLSLGSCFIDLVGIWSQLRRCQLTSIRSAQISSAAETILDHSTSGLAQQRGLQ